MSQEFQSPLSSLNQSFSPGSHGGAHHRVPRGFQLPPRIMAHVQNDQEMVQAERPELIHAGPQRDEVPQEMVQRQPPRVAEYVHPSTGPNVPMRSVVFAHIATIADSRPLPDHIVAMVQFVGQTTQAKHDEAAANPLGAAGDDDCDSSAWEDCFDEDEYD